MNSSKIIHQAKLNDWAVAIRQQQESSMSVTSWYKQNHLSTTQFYYWKRKLKDQFVESQLPDIVPITTPASQQCCTSCTTDQPLYGMSGFSTIKISVNDISIEINESTSEYLLSKVIKAVRHA